MPPSPFHGIFSFGQDLPRGTAGNSGKFSLNELEEDSSDNKIAVSGSKQSAPSKGQIAVDIFEQDGYYIIRAPIAGVNLNDLDIEVDEKVLTIRGTRKLADAIPEDQYYIQECFWGEFARSITLPCTIDARRVKATFSKDCILKVLVPKEEKVKIVRINEG